MKHFYNQIFQPCQCNDITFGDVDPILVNGGHRQDCPGDQGFLMHEEDKVIELYSLNIYVLIWIFVQAAMYVKESDVQSLACGESIKV